MMKNNKLMNFITKPPLPATIVSGTLGLWLLALAITLQVLELFYSQIRFNYFLVATIFILFSSYGVLYAVGVVDKFTAWALSNKYVSPFIKNYDLRTAAFAAFGALFDIVYGFILVFTGIYTKLNWNYVNGSYFVLLGVSQVIVLLYGIIPLIKQTDIVLRKKHYAKTYLLSAIIIGSSTGILTVLFDLAAYAKANIISSSAVLFYVNEIYAVIKIIVVIYGLIRSHKKTNLITRALRVFSTVAGFTSLYVFISSSAHFFSSQQATNVLSSQTKAISNGIFAFIFIMSLYMIIKSIKVFVKTGKAKKAEQKERLDVNDEPHI